MRHAPSCLALGLALSVLGCAGDTQPLETDSGAPAFDKVAEGQEHGGRPFSIALLGANEVPGPGDPDATGTAEITLNQGQGEVCYRLTAADVDGTMTGAHIHRGTATEFGPIVVHLSPPATGESSGCVENVDPELIRDIRQNPENYYVNVHSAPLYRPGAIRGQLSD